MRLNAFVPNITDPTSFYRVVGPFSQFWREDPTIDVYYPDSNANWSYMYSSQVCFIQRPYTPTQIQLADLAKECRTPLWLDYDDNVLELEPDNPAHDVYQASNVQQNVRYLLCQASHVTVTTQYLKERWGIYNPNITVIPNAWDDYRYPLTNEYQPREKIILWRGSPTHQRDLGEVEEQLIYVLEKNPSWKILFMGYKPWKACSILKERVLWLPFMELLQYFEKIQEIRPAIQIVPLADNPFNRSKSNIAWLEGNFIGATVLAPDLPEWKHADYVYNGTPQDFGVQLEYAMRHTPEAWQAKWSMSRNIILDKFTLSKVNSQRIQVLRNLMELNG